MNLDSDDSGHDEPKTQKLEENKNIIPIKDKCFEETIDATASTENQSTEKINEFIKPENKDQTDVKKPAPPSKKDIIVRKLKYQLK